MIADAIKKINDEMGDLEEKRVPAAPIVKYLIERLESDEKLSALVNQTHKTLKKCFDFVYEQVRKHAGEQTDKQSNTVWIDDNDVYLMAVDYFLADDAELERIKVAKEVEEDKKRQERMEENRINAENIAKQAALDKAQKALDKKQAPGQMSLLDLAG